MKTGRGKISGMLLMLAVALLAQACGKKSDFAKQNFSAAATANQYTKPKIDIVVFQDNSMSMNTPLYYLKTQLDQFLASINSQWDFHFTVLPLQSTMPFSSKYIVAQDCGTIHSGSCLTPDQSSLFNSVAGDLGWIHTVNVGTSNLDLGFQTMTSNLSQPSFVSSGFLRSDAALAIVVISNGEDTSGLTSSDYINQPGAGLQVNWNANSLTNSYNNFKFFMSNLKGGLAMSRFYSVVNLPQNVSPGSNYCYGDLSFVGVRYSKMSTDLASESFNVCDNGVSYVMDRIYGQLSSMVQAIIFNAKVLNEQPIVSSIQVKKNGVLLSNSSVDGWTYDGYQANQPTSIFPSFGNNATGYFVRLHGSATFQGNDVVEVTYQKM